MYNEANSEFQKISLQHDMQLYKAQDLEKQLRKIQNNGRLNLMSKDEWESDDEEDEDEAAWHCYGCDERESRLAEQAALILELDQAAKKYLNQKYDIQKDLDEANRQLQVI